MKGDDVRKIGALSVALFASMAAVALAGPGKGFSFRFVTFNIRFDFPSDAAQGNNWEKRAPLVAEFILKEAKANVVCFQEDKSPQVEDLKKLMPGWQFHGKSREGAGSEHCSVAFDTKVWRLMDGGDFWLSDTPDVPASNTWGTKWAHKCTWATLQAVKDAKKRTVTFTSTHFDEHKGSGEVRRKSAQVIRNWLDKNAKTANVVVAGDFNADLDEEPFGVLTVASGLPRLVDAFELAKSNPRVGTSHNFDGSAGTRRIDWIMVGGRINALEAHVDKWQKNGKYPSDHFPVVAELDVVGGPADKADGKKAKEPEVEPQVK
jgi:endonuclease/exonuclease/phosphatase family metal-dependent hydrolase